MSENEQAVAAAEVIEAPATVAMPKAKKPIAKKPVAKKEVATPAVEKKETKKEPAKKPAAKKETKKEAPKAKASKAPAKKEEKKPAAKKEKAAKEPKEPRAKKEGLRAPQVRILECLAKSKDPLSRTEISEKAPCDLAMLNSYIGSSNDEIREKCDAANFPSLVTLKFVKRVLPVDEKVRGAVYEISAAGRKTIGK